MVDGRFTAARKPSTNQREAEKLFFSLDHPIRRELWRSGPSSQRNDAWRPGCAARRPHPQAQAPIQTDFHRGPSKLGCTSRELFHTHSLPPLTSSCGKTENRDLPLVRVQNTNQKREVSDVTARIFGLKRGEGASYGCCCALTFTVTLFESNETSVFGLSLSCNFAVTLSVCDEAAQNVASKVQL